MNMVKVPSLFLLLLLVPGHVLAQTESRSQPAEIFTYEADKPLDLNEDEVGERDGAKIYNISYASPKGGRVTAYLVVPLGKQKCGGAIFLHGSGANRDQFLPEAITLAKSSIISLLIDSPSARPEPWRKSPYDYLMADRDIRIQSVIDLRRGLDLLLARRDINPKKIAFIGYSKGAEVGGVLAGVENRIRVFVLMAVNASQVEFWREPNNPTAEDLKKRLTPEKFETYVESLVPVEQVHYVGKATPAELFFQFGKQDPLVPVDSAKRLFEAASKPKTVKWYDAGHGLNGRASTDRMDWVTKAIGILQPTDRTFQEPR